MGLKFSEVSDEYEYDYPPYLVTRCALLLTLTTFKLNSLLF